jgi:hypothetical protein
MGARRPALDRCRGCADSGMNQGEIVRPAKLGPAGRLSWALAPAPTTSISIADLPCSIDSDFDFGHHWDTVAISEIKVLSFQRKSYDATAITLPR